MFFLAAFGSEIVGTIARFGSSTVFLPTALFFLDFKTAIVLVAIFHFFGNLGRISFFRHGLDKTILLRFGLSSVILTFIGALLVTYIPQETLKGVLGLFLIVYAIMNWKGNVQIKPSLTTSIVGGGLSGFLAGLIGTGGALRGAFLTAFGLPKEKYITTAASIALAVDVTRIPVYLSQGFLETRYYWYIPILFLIALLGSYMGKQIVSKFTQDFFRKVVLSTIFFIGIKFVLDWII